jgi:hypothetical protein
MTQIDWTEVSGLGLPRVGQLGFVVEQMETALPAYAALYNCRTWYRPTFTQNTIQVEGRQYEADWDILFGYSGKLQLELIDLRGDSANMFGDFLEREGPGLQHACYYVSDLDRKLARVESLGIQVLQRATLGTDGGFMARVVYLDTEALCGTTLELSEVRMGRFSLPSSKWIMELGVLLGDGEKIRI